MRRHHWIGGLGVLAGGAAAVVVIVRLTGALSPPPNEALIAPPVVVVEAPPMPLPLPPVAEPQAPLGGAAPQAIVEPEAEPVVAAALPQGVPVLAPAPRLPTPDCGQGPKQAAAANAASLRTLAWGPFHRPETGWEVYAPRIALEIGTACAPDTPGFAAALLAWEQGRKLPADGQVDAGAFNVMNTAWLLARPFVVASQKGCPPAAPPGQLVQLTGADIYGKPERLLPAALAAYRRMAADARAADSAIAADKKMLTVFSGYRDPAADAARCAKDNNCQGAVRTICSAHRTGLAVDLVVGNVPGMRPDSSDDANRLAQTKTPAYRWLIANAGRYGFVNYTFEPWHWEWIAPPEALGP